MIERTRWWTLAALLLVSAAAPAHAQEGADGPALAAEASHRLELARLLDQRLEAVEAERDIHVGVAVTTLEGEPVYSHDGEELMVLASNNKLVTTAAALLHLPPDFRWQTQAFLAGERLVLRGSGDPSLRNLDGDRAADRFLDGLAAALKDAGVLSLDEVVLDDRAFDRVFRHPLWPADQWREYYCAPVAALAVEGGCIRVVGEASGRIRTEPPLGSRMPLDRDVSFSRGREHTLSAWLADDDETILVRGNLTRDQTATLATRDPLEVFGRWVLHGLAQRGVTCSAFGLATPGEADPAGAPVFVHESAWTLAEAVAVANLDSDNFVTEMILKTLGQEVLGEGSFEAGARAVRQVLADAGLDPDDYAPTDGSGLARDEDQAANRATPGGLCRLLRLMAEKPGGRVLFDSLPIGGERGKLVGRFEDGRFQPRRVHAKTGWIRGASSLSGYLLAGDDEVLVFSIVVNYRRDGTARTNNARFKRLQEAVLADVLDSWPTS